MKKFWLIFKHEYLRHVLRARFIWALLSIPLIIVLSSGIGVLSAISSVDKRPIGYVDQSVLNLSITPDMVKAEGPLGKPVYTSFATIAEANRELSSNVIQSYYVIPADYMSTGKVEYHTTNEAAFDTHSQFRDILRANLAKDQSPEVVNRILDGPHITTYSIETQKPRQIMDFIFPLVSGLFLVIAMNITGGYLVQAMAEEKENRTMEILITSVSPTQLLTGKLAAIICVGLTQILVWMLALLGGLKFLSSQIGGLGVFSPDPLLVTVEIVIFLLAFIMLSALMVLIGISAAEASDAQGVASIVSLLLFIPIWLLWVLISQPNSPASVAMSLFPFTSPVAMPTRISLVNVPQWEIALAIGLSFIFAIASVWLAIRAFRFGMLRYGKKLTLREVVRLNS